MLPGCILSVCHGVAGMVLHGSWFLVKCVRALVGLEHSKATLKMCAPFKQADETATRTYIVSA